MVVTVCVRVAVFVLVDVSYVVLFPSELSIVCQVATILVTPVLALPLTFSPLPLLFGGPKKNSARERKWLRLVRALVISQAKDEEKAKRPIVVVARTDSKRSMSKRSR